MYSAVDFKVVWPNLLFKSRPQLPCRDLIHVATSRCCRDISSSLLQPATDVHDVATSISCRDISLCLWRFHWLLSVSRFQSSVATTSLVKSSSSFQTCHSFKAILMSRHRSHVATSTFVATTRCCRDIILLASGDSCRDQLLISFNYPGVATS